MLAQIAEESVYRMYSPNGKLAWLVNMNETKKEHYNKIEFTQTQAKKEGFSSGKINVQMFVTLYKELNPVQILKIKTFQIPIPKNSL